MIPTVIIAAATLFFFGAERILPGRELPEAPGWYARAAFLNICQLLIILAAGLAWNRWLQQWSLFHISDSMPPVFILLVAPCPSRRRFPLARVPPGSSQP